MAFNLNCFLKTLQLRSLTGSEYVYGYFSIVNLPHFENSGKTYIVNKFQIKKLLTFVNIEL